MESDFHPQLFVSQGSRALIVIDSNEVVRDWFLRGLAFRVMRYLIEIHGLQVAIPAVALPEIESAYAREVEKLETSLARVARDAARLGLEVPRPGASHLLERYGERLAEVLENLGIEVIDIPEVPHSDLVRRAVGRTPPFDASGGGYRDALVWLSALSAASSSGPLLIASRDKAFSRSDGELHEALVEEAAQRGVEAGLITDLGRWCLEQLPWAKEMSLPDVAAEVRDDRFATYLAQSDFPWDLDIEPLEIGLPASSAIVSEGGTVESIERVGARVEKAGETLVEYRITLDLDLRAELDADDARVMNLDYEPAGKPGRVSAPYRPKVTLRTICVFDEYDEGKGWYYLDLQPVADT